MGGGGGGGGGGGQHTHFCVLDNYCWEVASYTMLCTTMLWGGVGQLFYEQRTPRLLLPHCLTAADNGFWGSLCFAQLFLGQGNVLLCTHSCVAIAIGG